MSALRPSIGLSTITLALSLFGAALGGCSSEITCKDICACEGLTGDKICLQKCSADQASVAKQAETAGCTKQQETLSTCTEDNASCDSIKLEYSYPSTECTAEASALKTCFGGGTTSSSTGTN